MDDIKKKFTFVYAICLIIIFIFFHFNDLNMLSKLYSSPSDNFVAHLTNDSIQIVEFNSEHSKRKSRMLLYGENSIS